MFQTMRISQTRWSRTSSERVAMAQNAQKRLLHGIFGVGGIAQDGKGHAIEGRRVLVDQGRKRFLFRVLAGFVLHGAWCDLHPTCEY